MLCNVQTIALSFTETERAIISIAIENHLTPVKGNSKVFNDDDQTVALVTIHKQVNENAIRIPVTKVSAAILVEVVRQYFVKTQRADVRTLFLDLSTYYENYWQTGY